MTGSPTTAGPPSCTARSRSGGGRDGNPALAWPPDPGDVGGQRPVAAGRRGPAGHPAVPAGRCRRLVRCRRRARGGDVMLTGRRYLLAPTDEQAVYAEQVGAICRAVWNTALEQRREYRRRGAFISYVEQARQLAEAKKDPNCAWMADAPSHTLQQTLRDLEKACKTHGTWKVRWRTKARTAPSFRF